MRLVGLKVSKNKLSKYLRLAAGVETSPPRTGRSPLLADATLAEALREGWITPPALTADDMPPRKPVTTLNDLMRELRRDRG